MTFVERGDARLHYDVEGQGFPVFTLAPGGLRSANDLWQRAPWNPRVRLRDEYQVIGMDQRNAGASRAPIAASDGWHTYVADQLAVLDRLGVEQCHLLGMCIGGPFVAALLLAAPQRFRSAVLLQPAGLEDNRDAFYEVFDGWAADMRPHHPEADDAAFASFRSNLWDGEFVFSATPEQMAACATPLLVLMGNDKYHPPSVSRELARRAPNATLIERWRDDDLLASTDAAIRAFLAAHTP
ncbi:MAG TPA: alpha/beta hydrolase [Polyangiaceae bacterium]|nr:alpha/beta hydrolase [Polyangiaceae bacterium]